MLLKKLLYALCLLMPSTGIFAQNVAINNNGANPDINAMLDVNSNSKGLLIPRMDSNARKAIPNTIGLLLYDTDTHSFWYNDGTNWRDIAKGTGWLLGGNAGTNPINNFIGTIDNMPLVIKVFNQLSGYIDPSSSFYGYRSGEKTVQPSNTGIGSWTLNSNTVGTYNTAVGYRSMLNSIQGTENTAIGAETLFSNITGANNTAIGSGAMYSNVNGSNNTALGYFALASNTSATGNTALGYNSMNRNTTGGANTAIGQESLILNTTGSANTAAGYQALRFNTTGARNSAYGYRSQFSSTTGTDNTSMGVESLNSNTEGARNSAVGVSALRQNTTGYDNTALGYRALVNNTNGTHNSAFGRDALLSNIDGVGNSAFGVESLYSNTSGYQNMGLGDFSLHDNTTGFSNAAVGGAALENNTTGQRNVGIGDGAMRMNTTGNYNTGIGYRANAATAALENATAIGSMAIVDASNKVRIGNSAVTVIEGQVPFTTPSDGRFKFNVQEDVKGLEFILQLRPVTYQFNVEQYDERWSDRAKDSRIGIAENNKARINYSEALRLRRTGFIAQEVEQAAITSRFNFSGIVKPKTAGEHYSLSYESFVVPLVKAVQEQQEIIRELQQQVAELRLLIKKEH